MTNNLQIICLDFLGPMNGHTFLIVVLDNFSKYVLLQPLRKATTDGVIQFLHDHVLIVSGVPEIIVSDNGTQFVSKAFTDFSEQYSIQLFITPLYTPQCNPSERVNRVIVKSIRSQIRNGSHKDWDTHLASIGICVHHFTPQ